jgi:hypothetical protein
MASSSRCLTTTRANASCGSCIRWQHKLQIEIIQRGSVDPTDLYRTHVLQRSNAA